MSETGDQVFVDAMVGGFEDGVGQGGELGGGFGESREAENIARDDAQKLTAAEFRQFKRAGKSRSQGGFETPAKLLGVEDPVEPVKLGDPFGMFENFFRQKMAVGENGRKAAEGLRG